MPGENSGRILVFIREKERGREREREKERERERGEAGRAERKSARTDGGRRVEAENDGGEVSIVPPRPRGLGALPYAPLPPRPLPIAARIPPRALALSYYYYFLSQYLLFPHSVLC